MHPRPPASSAAPARFDGALAAMVGLAHRQPHGQRQRGGNRKQQPEDRRDTDMIDKHAGEQQAGDRTDAGTRDEQPNGRRDARGVDLLARQREGERRHSRTQTLSHPADDQHLDGSSEGAHQRPERKASQRGQQHPPTTEVVSQPSSQRRDGRSRDQKASQKPRHRTGRGVVVPLDRGQRRRDDRLLEPEIERADGEHDKHPPVPHNHPPFTVSLTRSWNNCTVSTSDGHGLQHARASSREPASSGSPVPASLTPLIGRESELAEIARLLAATRLLTLTGVGGAGKTRLALATAQCASEQEEEVFVVELAAVDSPERLAPAVHQAVLAASANGSLQPAGRSALDATMQRLTDRDALLVLDNCEHLSEASAHIVIALLGGCPRLRVLASSRQPLSVDGETVWPVPPLSLPAEDEHDQLAAIQGCDAGQLFLDRAARGRPGFALTADTAKHVALICRELEGLPLAIELAAARARVLSPAQIAAGLTDRMRLLGGGAATSSERLRSMRGSLDWSYALLDERERALLRNLAISSEWTLDAIEAVCTVGAEEFDGIARHAHRARRQGTAERHRRWRLRASLPAAGDRPQLRARAPAEHRRRAGGAPAAHAPFSRARGACRRAA